MNELPTLTWQERGKLIAAGLISYPTPTPKGPGRVKKETRTQVTKKPTRCRKDFPNSEDNERLRSVLRAIVRPSAVLRQAGNSHMPRLADLSRKAGLSPSALARFTTGRVIVMGDANRAKVWAVINAES